MGTLLYYVKSCENTTLHQVAGPQRDLHSGNDGGVFNEPLADLTKVLASLIDSRNNIQV